MAIETTSGDKPANDKKKTTTRPQRKRKKAPQRKKVLASSESRETTTDKSDAPGGTATQVDIADVAQAPSVDPPPPAAQKKRQRPARRRAKRPRPAPDPSAASTTDMPVNASQPPDQTVSKPEADAVPSPATTTGEEKDSTQAGDSPEVEPRKPARRRTRRGSTRRRASKPDGDEPKPAAREDDDQGEMERSEDLDVRDPAEDSEIQPYTDRKLLPKSKHATKDAGRREMIINVSAGYECRIAILHEGHLEELFIERDSTQSHVGNIYKGRITNVESSIQAAFIDFGLPKNGFLHISDVQPQYFPDHGGEPENVGRKIPRHHRPPIQKCFRRGQEVIVQITKEGVGTKGPTLTSYLSIPGRFLVMMPGMSRHGVSRKIEDEAARRSMRDLLNELTLPSDMGFILRTAGLDRTKRELQRDLNYLLRLWKTVVERIKRMRAPAALYHESDLVTRTIRDVYTTDFERVVVDDLAAAQKAREFLRIAMPRTKATVELYSDREPLFHRLGIEAEIERINLRHVPLASGGSLVIDSTEALIAIDVNSGRFRRPDDAEETALQINVEAAEEIARQLRLRDLGGLVVCDFIDMRHDRNKRKVEQALKDALKSHKERARILKMSGFGLIEMTRQRQGPSIRRNLYSDCPHCHGAGQVKMAESIILDVMRMIQLATHHDAVQKVTLSVSNEVAFQILNKKRAALQQIEAETGKTVIVRGDSNFTSDQVHCVCEDNRGREVAIGTGAAVRS